MLIVEPGKTSTAWWMLVEDVSCSHGKPPAQVTILARTINECCSWFAWLMVCVCVCLSVCRMQDCVCVFFVLRDVRNGYLHVEWRVIRRREQKQEDHSFFVLKGKWTEEPELWTKPKRETSVVSNQTESLHPPPTHAFLLQVVTTCNQREATWLVFANVFVSCKTKCTLQRATKPVCQRSNFIAYHIILDSVQMSLLISFTGT